MVDRSVRLFGRIFITGEIEARTGLRIGDTRDTLTIGGVDLPVIRNKRNNQPYIPGSSLKGKLRSLSEKLQNAPQNKEINKGDAQGKSLVRMHVAETREQYEHYPVNPLFGVTGDAGSWLKAPTRLVVRDIPLSEKSAQELLKARTDLPYTEVKWEAAIDRVTSAATPRQVERVPAGAVFGPMEIVLSVYLEPDTALLSDLLTAMCLLEDDYLGGHGSRGYGQVQFNNLSLKVRAGEHYQEHADERFTNLDLKGLVANQPAALDWIRQTLGLPASG